MKLGLILGVRNNPEKPIPLPEMYRRFIDTAVLAEELGFDFAWVSEHHFTDDSWTPSPVVVATAIAARTTRIRVGTQVICLPFQNPLRLAEDLAVLDNISNGRLDIGVSSGSSYEEFQTFGIPIEERFGRSWEAASIIEKCFSSTEPFTHSGRYFHFPDINFTTRPVQTKAPIWWGSFGPKNVKRAAERGYNLLSMPHPLYDQTLIEMGRDPADFSIAPMKLVCIADTDDQAWAVAEEGVLKRLNYYRLRRDLNGNMPDSSNALTIDQVRATGGSDIHAPIIGDPDTVRRRFAALRDGEGGRITHLVMDFHMPGMAPAVVQRSLELFASEVMPIFRR